MKTPRLLFSQFKAGLSTQAVKPDLYVKPSFKKAHEYLYAQKYDEAALHFSNWFDTLDVIWAIRNNGIAQVIKGHEFNLMAAFFGSRKISTSSDHLLEILPKDLGTTITQGQQKTTAVHIAAIFGGKNSVTIYEKMMNKLKAESQEGLLVAINSSDDTPIELAALHRNTEFIQLSRSICNKPSSTDLENFSTLGWYLLDTEDLNPNLNDALFNTSDEEKSKRPKI